MPHISTKSIKKKVFLKISDQLIRLIATTADQGSSRRLLLELLTPTERIMLAKRLAMVLMLNQGISAYHVWQTLKVSPSTAARFYRQVAAGRYRYLSRWLRQPRSAKRSATGDLIEQILFGVLPPRAGKNQRLFSCPR